MLVGNTYAIDYGEWAAVRHMRFYVEWLDRHHRRFSRARAIKLTAAQVGQPLDARVCASVSGAIGCVEIKLPSRIQPISGYLDRSCGSRRPTPPAYDPNFSFISAPQIAYGWNPCQPITWAIDSYAEPPLSSATTSWQALASQAIGQASAATGITFAQLADFATAPAGPGYKITPPPAVDLAIRFTPTAPDVAGTGGSSAYAGQFTVRGEVQIDSQATWEPSAALVVLLHEIGHAMGLNHPVPEPPFPDPGNEIMDPGNYAFSTYQPGDMCGLFEVTWQQPCAGASGLTLGQGTIPD